MGRQVSVDITKIQTARVVSFEEGDETMYGVDWDLDGGFSGSDLIGTKEEAQAELRRVRRAQRVRLVSSNG